MRDAGGGMGPGGWVAGPWMGAPPMAAGGMMRGAPGGGGPPGPWGPPPPGMMPLGGWGPMAPGAAVGDRGAMGMGNSAGMGRGGVGGVKEGDWSSHFVATGERPQNVCKNTSLVCTHSPSLCTLAAGSHLWVICRQSSLSRAL